MKSSLLKPWLAVGSIALGAFAFVTTEFLPVGILPQIAADTSVSTGTAGLLITIPGIMAAIAAPLLMIFAGKIDRRTLLLGLLLLLLGSNLISGVTDNFHLLLFARALFGIGLGGFWVLALATGSRIIPEHAAKATAVILGGVNLATIFGVPIGTFLSNLMSWKVSFLSIGSLALVALVAQYFLLEKLPSDKGVRAREITDLLKNKRVRMTLFMVAAVFGGHFAAYTFITPFLLSETSLSPGSISTVLLVFGIAGFIGNFAAASLSSRRLPQTVVSVIAGLALATLGLALFSPSNTAAIGLVTLWGLAFGGIPLCMSVWMAQATPDQPEAGMAVLISALQIFIAAGSYLGGMAVDGFGSAAPILLGGSLAVTALGIFALQRDPEKKPLRSLAALEL